MIINHFKRGITALELLVVLAVLGIIFAIVIPQFSKIRENQVLKSATNDVLSSLNKARVQTLASMDSSSYGVHFQSDKVIIFKGIVFSVDDLNNETINIIAPATISNVTLSGISGNSGDVYFNRLSGSSNQTGTVTISTSSFSKIITIFTTGAVSEN
ncbi:MAG: prepilin-type N-terminal cleavage/methylation domain-containing protein [Candidatus Paceibacterota bacterium]